MDSDLPPPYEETYQPSLPPLPKKNYALFHMSDNDHYYPYELWAGKGGELPMFLEVNVGHNPDDEDPFMYPYESGELLFLFKRGSQKRALLLESHQRTLSLPLSSEILFVPMIDRDRTPNAAAGMTLAQILELDGLPLKMEFHNKQLMEFEVDRRTCGHDFFGDLVFSGVYEENYFWCLAIDAHGTPGATRVLPENLHQVCFSHIDKVKLVADSDKKLQEYMNRFTKAAEAVDLNQDPFFKELAIVDRGKHVFKGEKIEPYIDQNTFVPIRYKKRPVPAPPGNAPSLPPRNPVPQAEPQKKSVRKRSKDHTSSKSPEEKGGNYTPVEFKNDEDEHEYERIHQAALALGDDTKKGGKMGQGTQLIEGSADAPIYEPTPKADTFPRIKTGAVKSDADSLGRSLSTRAPARIPDPEVDPSSPPPPVPPRPHAAHSTVTSLSIEEVGERLKQLGLKKYRKAFKENRIDGVLLTRLSETALREDFRMTSVEALRLVTFVSTGHIPSPGIPPEM